jgi:hypothetical protein
MYPGFAYDDDGMVVFTRDESGWQGRIQDLRIERAKLAKNEH